MWYAWVLYISRPVIFAIFALTKTVAWTALAMMPTIIDQFKANMSHLSPTVSTYMLFLSAFDVCATGVDISITSVMFSTLILSTCLESCGNHASGLCGDS